MDCKLQEQSPLVVFARTPSSAIMRRYEIRMAPICTQMVDGWPIVMSVGSGPTCSNKTPLLIADPKPIKEANADLCGRTTAGLVVRLRFPNVYKVEPLRR